MTQPKLDPANRRCSDDDGAERRCPACGEWWPEADEFFYRDARHGCLQSWCKACTNRPRRSRIAPAPNLFAPWPHLPASLPISASAT